MVFRGINLCYATYVMLDLGTYVCTWENSHFILHFRGNSPADLSVGLGKYSEYYGQIMMH